MVKLPKMPRGEGSFFYHRNDTIGYRKTFILSNGKKTKKTVYGDTPQECIAKMKIFENQLEEGRIVSKDLLIDALYKWLDTYVKGQVKQQTYERYIQTVNNQIVNSSLDKCQYQKISSDDIQQFLNELNKLNYSYSTIDKTYRILHAFYRFTSMRDNFSNPMILVQKPKKVDVNKNEKKVVWFEEDDIEKFIKECCSKCKSKNSKKYKYKYGLILAANIYLGLRIGELLALQWKDIDLENNTIKVTKTLSEIKNPKAKNPNEPKNIFIIQKSTKTNIGRIVPISPQAKKLIIEYKNSLNNTENDDYVITTKNKNHVSRRDINKIMDKIQKNAQTEIQGASSHTLRHTCASLYFKHGVPVEIIAKILGHSPEICRKTYIGLAKDDLQLAANSIITNFDF